MKSIDIMFPVYHGNLHEIEPCADTVVPFFRTEIPEYKWRVVFAINGANPEKLIELIDTLNKRYPEVGYEFTPVAGKGSGVMHSWSQSTADIAVYMDVDLATDVGNFRQLIGGVEAGNDLSIGSRYHPGSDVKRSFKRKFVSIVYHKMFMRYFLRVHKYTDAQCGYKAINQRVIKEILPKVKNKTWFFESELLFLAEKGKYRIHEIPVKWKESRFSGITLYKAIWEFITCSFELVFRKR